MSGRRLAWFAGNRTTVRSDNNIRTPCTPDSGWNALKLIVSSPQSPLAPDSSTENKWYLQSQHPPPGPTPLSRHNHHRLRPEGNAVIFSNHGLSRIHGPRHCKRSRHIQRPQSPANLPSGSNLEISTPSIKRSLRRLRSRTAATISAADNDSSVEPAFPNRISSTATRSRKRSKGRTSVVTNVREGAGAVANYT